MILQNNSQFFWRNLKYESFQLLSIGVVAGDAFFIFPWWFAVIHLAAIIGKKFDEDDHEAAFSNQYEATNTE